jgi:uncharacterized protein (TIGR01244 family)
MKKVTDKLHVGSQVTVDGIGWAKGEGIAAIVNNRPDGEEAGQPAAAEVRKASEAAGLGYIHLPVVSGRIEEDEVRAFQKAVAAAPGPVLAHCRSGTRSLTLYVLGEVLDGRMKKDEVIPFGQRLGFDLAGAVKWLEARGY